MIIELGRVVFVFDVLISIFPGSFTAPQVHFCVVYLAYYAIVKVVMTIPSVLFVLFRAFFLFLSVVF
jgi:hypothetical protein